MTRRVRRTLAGGAAGLLLAAAAAAGSAAAADLSMSLLAPVPTYIGGPATPNPIAHPPIPQHPYLSPNGTNSMHNDAYASDAYEVSGPLGIKPRVKTMFYGLRECATMAFDSRGRIVGLCGGLEGFRMMVINPVTLRPISQLITGNRDLTSGANPFTDICGGSYFFLDAQDRAYPTTVDKAVWQIQVRPNGTMAKEKVWNLAAHMPKADCLIATMPDWSGRIWFFTQQGLVGTLDRATGTVRTAHLPAGETVTNSVATDETGGMYVVSTHALYRLDATGDGTPQVTWRETYDRGTRTKPGNLSQGSGTTPTLLGDRWVAINDNADPKTQVLVYDRRTGVTDRLHCAVPVLRDNAGTTDNSLVAAGNSFIIENNYGYQSPATTLFGKSTTPGLARVMVEDDGCHVAWESNEIAPTSVAKASLGNGLLYAYTKPVRKDLIDAWYFTAIDIETGETVWSRLTGKGITYNNHYAAIYLGPDGAAYIATLTGMVKITDRP